MKSEQLWRHWHWLAWHKLKNKSQIEGMHFLRRFFSVKASASVRVPVLNTSYVPAIIYLWYICFCPRPAKILIRHRGNPVPVHTKYIIES